MAAIASGTASGADKSGTGLSNGTSTKTAGDVEMRDLLVRHGSSDGTSASALGAPEYTVQAFDGHRDRGSSGVYANERQASTRHLLLTTTTLSLLFPFGFRCIR